MEADRISPKVTEENGRRLKTKEEPLSCPRQPRKTIEPSISDSERKDDTSIYLALTSQNSRREAAGAM